MDAEFVIRGQHYVATDENGKAKGFYIGGLNRPAQIPDDATPISEAMHRLWGADTSGQVLSQDGSHLEAAPVPVVLLPRLKVLASMRVQRAGEIQARSDVPRRTERQARVWAATVRQAISADLSGSIIAGQFPFVDAYFAGSLAANLDAAIGEIMALDAAEQNAEAVTELAVQTALAAIEDAMDEAGVDAVFPIFK